MPIRIIALYVLLLVRLFTNGVGVVMVLATPTPGAWLAVSLGWIETTCCLFLLVCLAVRKPWIITAFRIYIAFAVLATLCVLLAGFYLETRRGEDLAWVTLFAGTFVVLFLSWFAIYVGGGPTPTYLREGRVPPAPPSLPTAARRAEADPY